MKISFGGGGARACAFSAGILAALEANDVSIDLISANSGGSWAVSRWRKGASVDTPHDLNAAHDADHILFAASKHRVAAEGLSMYLTGTNPRKVWSRLVSDMLRVSNRRKKRLVKTSFLASKTQLPGGLTQPVMLPVDDHCVDEASACSSFAPGLPLTAFKLTAGIVPRFGNIMLFDGGYFDNLAVFSLLIQGETDFVAVVNSYVPPSSDADNWPDNDIGQLFGLPSVVGGRACHAFAEEDLLPTMQVIIENNGIASCQYNYRGAKCRITWIYLMAPDDFFARLPESLAAAIRRKIPRFPHVPTMPPGLTLEPFTANAIFMLGRYFGNMLVARDPEKNDFCSTNLGPIEDLREVFFFA